eukprot:scaffold1900_cov32-Tisochrysis_lutea.AAC.4
MRDKSQGSVRRRKDHELIGSLTSSCHPIRIDVRDTVRSFRGGEAHLKKDVALPIMRIVLE